MSETKVAQAAGEVLGSIERVRGGTRTRVRAAWFPLVVFGALTLASIALYDRPFDYPSGDGGFSAGPYVTPYYAGIPGARSQLLAYLFWLFLAPLSYLACAAWYRRRSRRIGVSFRWERWVGAGLGLFGLLQALLAMPLHEPGRRITTMQQVPEALFPEGVDRPGAIDGRMPPGAVVGEVGGPSAAVGFRDTASAFLTPLVAVAIGLLVLARVERSRVVAVVAGLYGALVVLVNTYGPGQVPPWVARPYGAERGFFVAPAHNLAVLALLLFAGAGLCALRSRHRHRHRRRRAAT